MLVNCVHGRGLLNLYTSLYKGFKDKFFRLRLTKKMPNLIDNPWVDLRMYIGIILHVVYNFSRIVFLKFCN